MDQKKRYIIKLGLNQNKDESTATSKFFRRFTLDGLGFDLQQNTQETGLVSVLSTRALELAKLSTGVVDLFYEDEDGDAILIGNDQDVYDALIEADNNCVKVYADVKPQVPKVVDQPSQTIPDVVDAIADVLSSAAEAASAGVDAFSVASSQPDAKVEAERLQAVAKTHLSKIHKESKLRLKEAKKHLKQTQNRMKVDMRAVKHQMRVAVAQSKQAARAVAAPKEPMFIHGRHTCDQCLTTPIIGKRFHAVNLPDYDLCERCFKNYKGVDIKFEESLLDRDVGPQDRWRRKYHTILGRRCDPPVVVPEVQPEAPKTPAQPEAPKTPAQPEAPVAESDLSLQEAIRRSLVEKPEPKAEEEATSSTTTPQEEVKDVVEEPDIVVPGDDDDEPAPTDSIVLALMQAPRSPSMKTESFVSEASSPLEAFVGETLDRMGEAIDDLNDQGQTIIDGEDDSGSSGWSVVQEDDDLAHGTSVIGSALFNSDNHADEISDVTSVPTEIQSIAIPQPVLDRWSLQLDKLHELGFMNDARSVDILEKLAAANIGVGSDDEITVQQVVNELTDY